MIGIYLSVLLSAVLQFTSPKPADIIPFFSFQGINDKPFTSAQISRGKKVLIVFYDVDCEHCQKAISYFNMHVQDLKNIQVYLVSTDTKPQIVSFMKSYGLKLSTQRNTTLLLDKKNEFIGLFKPRRYPSVFLYDSDRKLLLYEDNEDTLFRFLSILNKKSATSKSLHH